MKKSRFSEHQIIAILKEADAGMKVQDVCRQCGISPATYSQWKAKFGGMEASDVKKLRDLEAELSQYKRVYAELAHANDALKEMLLQKSIKPF